VTFFHLFIQRLEIGRNVFTKKSFGRIDELIGSFEAIFAMKVIAMNKNTFTLQCLIRLDFV
jgi:hypothetical protein